ncbi:MAG: ABC transporter permease [Nocardioidaceae bacterium]
MVDAVRGFAIIAGAWVRSALSYRTSFVIGTLVQLVITFLDFAAIIIMFGHIEAFGGFSISQIALLYAMSGFALGAADMLVGNAEALGRRIRDGSFDQMLIRPVPALAQVAADRFALRRIGRIAQSGVVLTWAISAAPIDWSVARVVVLAGAMACGAVIFCAVFVMGGAFQVFAGDAAEVANAFTYGGNTLTQYPLTIYPSELVKGVTFIVPIAFVNWYPGLFVLGMDDPFGLPGWLQFASPVAAVAFVVVAAAFWRTAIRHYRSTGS